MTKDNFDRLLATIQNEKINDALVDQAGERVWKEIAGSPALADASARSLRSCEDFQALIPDYLAKTLAPARMMLVQDHVHACVACRHAMERERDGTTQNALQKTWEFRPKRSSRWMQWALGVAATAAVAAITFAFLNGMLPGQHAVRASVKTIDGAAYASSGIEAHVIPTGFEVREGDRVHTAKGSSAIVQLSDGSLVEMGERADISISRSWKGTTIHLGGGQVIVQAAKQRTGRLYVATDDGVVSVKGTIFSVNHGIKGSRVAVIEGVVHVDYGNGATDLHAGDEATSSSTVARVPISDEIRWSKNSAKYLALLGDFSILQKQFAAIPSPGLRYNSELIGYVPDDTVVYAAIPNLTNTLNEAEKLFEDRLQQSPELRNWWKQQQKGGPKVEDVLNQVKTFSSYLGDEIVVAVAKTGTEYSSPVLIAKIKQSGLEDFLQTQARIGSAARTAPGSSATGPVRTGLQIIHDPWSATPQAGHPLMAYIGKDLLVASADLSQLQRTVQLSQQPGTGHFAATPFYQQVVHSYEQGAEWLLCVDMEQIVAKNVSSTVDTAGMSNVRYLTMEHREVSGKSESHADLTFASERQGVASWLGQPASMGSLEFVSPEASMVTSAVVKNPKSILEELFKMADSKNSNFQQGLAEFEAKTGVNVLNDIAAPLGGEVTMAFDGPMVPTPRWKLIVEVYDPATLQSTIGRLIDSVNRESQSGRALQLTQKQVGPRTYYAISSANAGGSVTNPEVDYTYVDNYLVAGPDMGTVSRAIQTRESGYTLPHSSTFTALLPSDGYTNFSAIFYHNLGPVIGPLAAQVKASGALTAKQQQSIDALTSNTAPGLIYVYGQSDRIEVASNTGFMGFDLGTLLTMGKGGPFLPQMILSGNPNGAVSETQ